MKKYSKKQTNIYCRQYDYYLKERGCFVQKLANIDHKVYSMQYKEYLQSAKW